MNSDFFKQWQVASNWLQQNDEWKGRYANYAQKIKENIGLMQKIKSNFHQWAPLHLYMNVGKAQGKANSFNLRFRGQDVADIVYGNDAIYLQVTKSEGNEKYFSLKDFPRGKVLWLSEEAKVFRKHFQSCEKFPRVKEHMLESFLLDELEKTDAKSKNDALCGVQPVKIAGICRFQMPTPFTASDPKNLKYSAGSGGGIDILARVGRGGGTTICIMELKKDFTITAKPMLQAVSYATFIQELLASECGNDWYEIFGFQPSSLKKDNITIKVCEVMPGHATKEEFLCETIATDYGKLELRTMYVNKDWDAQGITSVTTNLFDKL